MSNRLIAKKLNRFCNGTILSDLRAECGKADGVDHPKPIVIDQYRRIIIRLIGWSDYFGRNWSDTPVFPMHPDISQASILSLSARTEQSH